MMYMFILGEKIRVEIVSREHNYDSEAQYEIYHRNWSDIAQMSFDVALRHYPNPMYIKVVSHYHRLGVLRYIELTHALPHRTFAFRMSYPEHIDLYERLRWEENNCSRQVICWLKEGF